MVVVIWLVIHTKFASDPECNLILTATILRKIINITAAVEFK